MSELMENMQTMSWKNQVVEHVLDGDLNQAICLIKTNLDKEEKPMRVLLGLQCYRYQNTIRQERNGVISAEQGVVIKEKIVKKILEVSFQCVVSE